MPCIFAQVVKLPNFAADGHKRAQYKGFKALSRQSIGSIVRYLARPLSIAAVIISLAVSAPFHPPILTHLPGSRSL